MQVDISIGSGLLCTIVHVPLVLYRSICPFICGTLASYSTGYEPVTHACGFSAFFSQCEFQYPGYSLEYACLLLLAHFLARDSSIQLQF